VIFATYWFLAFAAVFFPLFWLLRNSKARFGLLIGASAIFHTHYAGPAGVIPIIALGITVYFLGLSSKKIANTIGIIACVAVLLTYKYSVFLITSFVSSIHAGLGAFLAKAAQENLPAVPPLAVSFFVFEFVHYLVDRRRGTEPIRNPLDFAVFSIFFPTLVAGPIKRYEQFLPSVHKALQEVCSRDVMTGMVQMCLGFSKKLIADNLTLWVESSHGSYADMSLESRWMFFAAIGFRILLDFSGYSDIAIGLARMMGITIPPNFNWPYLSTNIRDFWHRWHISLSSWIRDYVYIPLGGNRHGNFRRFLNGLVAFSLCGLWHGPAWNFVLWGLYHGLGLSISNAYRQIPFGIGMRLEQTFHRVPLLGWAVTLLFVWLGWLLFFYPAPEAWRMAKLLFVF
jgi:alginate O-acetyltransferase complex protein AlgI